LQSGGLSGDVESVLVEGLYLTAAVVVVEVVVVVVTVDCGRAEVAGSPARVRSETGFVCAAWILADG
jgi:hypothetical protein